jgi:hypothetical protein
MPASASPQRVNGIAHSTVHVPIEHTCPGMQTLPQAPQWERSMSVLTQAPEHSRCPPGQSLRHMPITHTCPIAMSQVTPHAPQ